MSGLLGYEGAREAGGENFTLDLLQKSLTPHPQPLPDALGLRCTHKSRDPYWSIRARCHLDEEPNWALPYGYAVKQRRQGK
ncbi:hypothetical protein LC653_19590 [Nostoc sp. CHAB 5784]|uniref:hypothetical protein n=1 Tax=Nostoc mirabile TaxID=2907820 RepID=UPI001E3DF7BB|nr:hypothetical protein [Nostoc mirabile]MCC5666063.1 hypothetical protein [Nostoc mirabile CHAB5784]